MLHYIIRMCAYVCARKEKGIVLTETSGIFRHISSLQKNARTFDIKRKCVSIQTQGRFGSNASAFWMERKGVFLRTKNKVRCTKNSCQFEDKFLTKLTG